MQAYAPGLDFSIGPRTDDHRWETDRPGFTVHAEVQGTGKEVGYLHAFEGYTLDNRGEREVVVEPDTLHIQYVSAASRLPYGLGEIAGVGTVLVRRAVEYAVAEGFTRGRTEPINPRVITILQKLQHEGTIGELELYGGNPLLQTVERLRETGEFVMPTYAKELLGRRHVWPGSINFCIRAIFEL